MTKNQAIVSGSVSAGLIWCFVLTPTSQRIRANDPTKDQIITNRVFSGDVVNSRDRNLERARQILTNSFRQPPKSSVYPASMLADADVNRAEAHNAAAMRQFQPRFEAALRAGQYQPLPNLYPTVLEKLSR